jgi:hypothetical protein
MDTTKIGEYIKMISIVIPLSAPLGFGSRNNDIELRYCLRSIEKHLSGYGDIFLIGHKPKWVNNVIHIPAEDEQRTWWKERNIYRKILLACEDPRVSDDFLFMNDDHYLLADFVAGEFPYYYEAFLSRITIRDDQYGATARNTAALFNHNPCHYDIHCPIVYNKEVFKLAFEGVDWEKKHGYCIKTVYCNYLFKHFEHREYPDLKIDQPLSIDKIAALLNVRSWFSIGNKSLDLGGSMAGVLEQLYKTKSKFELL